MSKQAVLVDMEYDFEILETFKQIQDDGFLHVILSIQNYINWNR